MTECFWLCCVWCGQTCRVFHHAAPSHFGCLTYYGNLLGNDCYLKACTFVKFNSLQLMSLMFLDKLAWRSSKGLLIKMKCEQSQWRYCVLPSEPSPVNAEMCLSSWNIGSHSLRVSKWECRICPEGDNSYFLFSEGNSEKKHPKKSMLRAGVGERLQILVLNRNLFHMCQNFNWQSLLTAMSMLHLGLLLDNKLFHKRGDRYLRTC